MDESFSEWLKQVSNGSGVDIVSARVDLNSWQTARSQFDAAISDRQISGLANLAGAANGALFMMTPIEDMKKVFEINLFSTIAISQIAVKRFMKARAGRIVNVSSVSAKYASRGFLTYGASKSSIEYVTKVMAAELSSYGIAVNAVSPGMTETRMLDETDVVTKDLLLNMSFSKRASTPNEVAQIIEFLLLDSPTQVTGKIIEVDGGMP
jgi:3-oxoacyl-[acyl-carrier protein] reductase